MSVSHARPAPHASGQIVKMRPFPRRVTLRARATTAVGLTAPRTAGVGTPTIESEPESGLPTQALIREAIDTALDTLDTLERQAGDVARRFRRRALDEAQLGLSHLVQSTQLLLKLADMAADATGTDLETLCESHGIPAAARTNAAVSDLIHEQMSGDWLALATVIERPFVGALMAWRAVFNAIGGPDGPHGHAA